MTLTAMRRTRVFRRVLGSKVAYRTDSLMAVLVAAGCRRWDNRWLCLPWLQRGACVAVAALLLSITQDGISNPTGGQVVSGSATISSSADTLRVDQQTKIVIIDWSKFDIAKGETTQFNQPGSSALAVNRIGGNDPSKILGSLLANGRIVLINGNGILFGPHAKVDVGALIATTADARNEDIASGKATFDKAGNPNAMIVNQGVLSAKTGMVGLIAPAVRNDGVIVARLGSVTLGASNIFTVDFTGDGLISFPLDANVVSKAIDANGKPVEALVVNNGRIEGVTVLLTARAAKDLVRNVISMGGTSAANKVAMENDKVVLSIDSLSGDDTNQEAPEPVANSSSVVLDGDNSGVSVSGTVDVRGIKGGTIDIKGGRIELAGATLNVSGTAGGGAINIGGNTTDSVSVDQASLLNASAVLTGNGGSIYVMSNATQFAGRAEAKGGAAGGNGGTIETSGHTLDTAGANVDTSAVSGIAGNWLLDPDDYTIDATQASTIQNNLANGNVTIQTTLAGSGGNGDIFVNALVSWSNANSLTLSAYRNVAVNANIANSGGAAVILRADNTGTGIGAVSFAGGRTISTSGEVSIFYNPSVNPASSLVNVSSYANPTENYATNGGGGGTLTAYMLVNSVYDLQNVQNNLSGTYALGRDIDASTTAMWNGGAGFNPIGSYWSPFNGHFSGDGHAISSIAVGRPSTDWIGLFSRVGGSGMIENVTLNGGTVSGRNVAGAIVGWNGGLLTNTHSSATTYGGSQVGGLVGLNTGTISHSNANGYLEAWGYTIGGLVGNNDGGTITQSNASTATNAASTSISYAYNVGGLVGFSSGTVTSSYATGNVHGSARLGSLIGTNTGLVSQSYATGNVEGYLYLIGGLVGHNNGGTITQSYATGSVNGDFGYSVGGLVGENSGTITQSYSTGNVAGTGNLGGLVGSNSAAITSSYSTGTVYDVANNTGAPGYAIGGFVGYNNGGTLAQDYATGMVTGSAPTNNYVGGLVGWNASGSISQSFASGSVWGVNAVGGLVGYLQTGAVSQSYWDMQSTGQTSGVGVGSSTGATGLTSSQARTQSSYGGWDFAGIWFMIDVETRPLLRSEYSTTITNAHQLQLMAMDLSASYTLANDIDLGPALAADAHGNYAGMWGSGGFVPVGTFSGLFDGQARAIKNLVISRPSSNNVGLFSVISSTGEVSGFGLVGGHLTGLSNDGALAGTNYGFVTQVYATNAVDAAWGGSSVGGLVGANYGVITQSSATGTANGPASNVGGLVGANSGAITQSYSTGSASGRNNVGGLAGYSSGTITQTHAAGYASPGGGDGWTIGGLVGWNDGGQITQSYASGAAAGRGSQGGLVGRNSGTITLSFATGSASSGDDTTGGLVGWNDGNGRISDSYATGNVRGRSKTGGLVGKNEGSVTTSYASAFVHGDEYSWSVGGFVGDNRGAISVSYATGNVESPHQVGGFVGYNAGSISNAYSTGSVNGYNWDSRYVGGFVAVNDGNISQSYTSGTVLNGGQWVGGFAGTNSGHFAQSYWNIDTTSRFAVVGGGDSTGLTGLTTAQFTNGALPAGFDRSIWGERAGSYPCLLWQAGCTAVVPSITAITYSVEDSSSTYGTLAVLGAVTLTGVSSTDQANVSGVLGLFDTSNSAVSLVDSLNAGSYTVKVTGLAGSAAPSYTIAPTGNHDGTLTIDPAPLVVAVNNASRIYGDANPEFSANITGFALGQDPSVLSGLYLLTSATSESGRGTYAITAVGGTATNYTIVSTTDGTLTVTPRPITVTANNTSRVYGDANPDLSYGITTGMLVNDDTLSGALATSAAVTSGVGDYAINQGTLAASTNYALTFQQGTLSVLPRPITVAAANQSRVYGDPNPPLTFDVASGDLVNGDVLTGLLATAADPTSGIGNYAINQGTLAASANYALSFQPGTLTVTTRSITVTADSKSRLYGNSNPALSYTVTSGSLANSDGLIGFLVTSADILSNVGGYAINRGTLSASANYALTFQPGTLTVNPAPLTVAVNDANRVYGDDNPGFTARITGLKLGQSASVLLGLTFSTSATRSSNMGEYAITSSGGTATNYVITTRTDGTLLVVPRAITVTADDRSRIYGDANPDLTYHISSGNLVNGDGITGVLTTAAAVTSSVGNYAIEQGTLAASTNYTLSFQPGTLTVTPRSITVTADDTSRLYGDSNPSLNYHLTSGNLVNGDSLNGTMATAADLAANVGHYTISQGTLSATANYALSFVPGTLTINPAPLMVAVNNASRAYGDVNPAFSAMVTGLKLGQNAEVLSGLTFATAATPASSVGSYAITSSGGTAANYYIAGRTNGTLTVGARAISVAANNLARLYGDANPALTYRIITGNLVNGDRLSGILATSAVVTSNAGTYAITQGTLAASPNYALTFAPGVLTILARPVTVTANNTSRTYGDANPSLTYRITSGTLVNGDALAGSLTTPAGLASNVGNYAINRGTLSLSSNYVLNFQPGMLAVTQRSITVTADNVSRVYGDANPALAYAVTSGTLVNGDNLAGGLATSALLTSNVGSYAIGRGSLSATSNYNLAYQAGTLTVTARPITVTANDVSRDYGDPDPILTYAVTSGMLVNGDTLSGGLGTDATQSSAVGTYAVSQATLAASPNYSVSFRSGRLTINPAPLTVSVNDAQRQYGYPNPEFGATITGLKLGEGAGVLTGLTFWTDATQVSPVGTYVIASAGGSATNYIVVTRLDGTLTVEPLPLATTQEMAAVVTYLANVANTQGVMISASDLAAQAQSNFQIDNSLYPGNDDYIACLVAGGPQQCSR